MPHKTLLAIAFLGLISACSEPQQTGITKRAERTEVTLPPVHVRGAESSSFSLYAKGQDGVTTAMGQIFIPPEGHTSLIKVGFLCRNALGQNQASDINVKLRISAWMDDRPASSTLWVSEPALVNKELGTGWLFFEVPHIKLNPNQRYIAWLSMSGLQNTDDASLGVVSMGARTTSPQPRPNEPYQPNSWTVDYPEGTRAFWRHSNPDGLIDDMLQSSWITDGNGQNLHFKMVFENKKTE